MFFFEKGKTSPTYPMKSHQFLKVFSTKNFPSKSQQILISFYTVFISNSQNRSCKSNLGKCNQIPTCKTPLLHVFQQCDFLHHNNWNLWNLIMHIIWYCRQMMSCSADELLCFLLIFFHYQNVQVIICYQ